MHVGIYLTVIIILVCNQEVTCFCTLRYLKSIPCCSLEAPMQLGKN